MNTSSNQAGKPLWAITTYFNVDGNPVRLGNYKLFRSHLVIPLVTVELSFGGPFQLCADDAEILIQLKGGDRMWQKERLLNLAVDALPPGCEAVAWLDCDVLLEEPDWPAQALVQLSGAPLIQPFSQAIDLPRGQFSFDAGADSTANMRQSVISLVVEAKFKETWFREPGASMHARYAPGFAWVAHRELIEKHGIYDANILGIGDKLLINASLGKWCDAISGYRMNAAQAAHYTAWARDFYDDVKSNVAFVPQRLYHLWHGDLVARRYGQKVLEFERFDFDPLLDINVGHSGPWEWNSDKPEMHAFVNKVLLSHQAEPGFPGVLEPAIRARECRA